MNLPEPDDLREQYIQWHEERLAELNRSCAQIMEDHDRAMRRIRRAGWFGVAVVWTFAALYVWRLWRASP